LTEFNLGFRIPQFKDLLGSGVFTQEGKDWYHSRGLLRPLFASNRFQAFEDIRRCVEDMLDDIVPNTVVDLQPRIFQLTLATTLFMLFGDSAHRMISAADKEGHDLASAFNDAQEYLAYRTRVGPFHWLIDGPGMWRACKTVHSFLDKAIEEALGVSDERLIQQSEHKRYVFIDALIQKTRDPVVLRDQCISLLLAGRDSTAACLSWTM
jgi:cytochrome P450